MTDRTPPDKRRLRNRRHRDARCIFPRCDRRQQRSLDLPLCSAHVQQIERALAERPPEITHRCIWPTCVEYIGGGWRFGVETRLCSRHLAIVLKYGRSDIEANRILREMNEPLDSQGRVQKAAPSPSLPVEGTIYYVQVGEHIKVGWTADMDKRMRTYPPTSRLLATEPGTRADEKRRHKMLAHHRTHGREWYAPTPSVLHHIEMVREKHGEPDAALFAAKPVTLSGKVRRNDGPHQKGWVRGSVNRPLRG